MATIYDVARRAKVSTYTVSAVMNSSAYVSPELTRRVRKAVRDLDYTINDLARSLQTRKTHTVGMLIPDLANPFYAKVVRGAEDVLKAAGYSLFLGNTYDRPEEQSRYLQVFRSKQVEGVLLFTAPGDGEDLRQMVKARKPVVFVGRGPQGFAADSVTADNTHGTEMAVSRLIGKGHRRVAIIIGHPTLTTSTDRVAGWESAQKKAGLKPDKRLIGEGDWTAESARAVTLAWLDASDRPTAIFASNFLMMIGVLAALKDRGQRCPQDMEVMSSDESEWLDVFEPKISTVVQPSYEIGSKSAELLLKRMDKPGRRYEKISLAPELRIRE